MPTKALIRWSILVAIAIGSAAAFPADMPGTPQILPRPASVLPANARAITLGDLADAQEARLREEFMKLHPSPEHPAPSIAPSPASVAPVLRPGISLRPTAIWGQPGQLHAEMAVDGRIRSVAPGETSAQGLKVTGLRPDALELETVRGKSKPSTRRRWLALGETLWINP